ncbi:MAG: sulfite exporter TauE/SafE family protein [Thermoflavifilum sp.]|nr:sulfite exporter TauE/SafE family protein [Thermoflavifilum sp.]
MIESLTLFQQLLVVVSGIFVGFSLGLIGGGGSILAVPLLLYVVGYHDPHVVIGTTAISVAVTAYINLIPHWRAGNVRWRPALLFALPGAFGSAIGAMIGKVFPGKQLLFLFALLMVAVAISMLRRKEAHAKTYRSGRSLLIRIIPIAFLVGLLSGFFGIGGGFLIVPGLMFAAGIPLINAIGSSLFSVGTFGLVTAITYAVSNLVDWLVVVEYVVGGIMGGFFGARLAMYLGAHKNTLASIFAFVILIVAAYMLYVNFKAVFHT